MSSHEVQRDWISKNQVVKDGISTWGNMIEKNGIATINAISAAAACRDAVSVSQRGSWAGRFWAARSVKRAAISRDKVTSGRESKSANKAWRAESRAAHSSHESRCVSISARFAVSLSRYSLSCSSVRCLEFLREKFARAEEMALHVAEGDVEFACDLVVG